MTINRFDRKRKLTAFAVFAAVLSFSFGLSHSRLHMTLEPSGSSRWRNDNGTEATATFAAAEDTALANVAPGAAGRLRFAAGNDGAQSELLRHAALALEPEEFVSSAVIDAANGYAYFGTDTEPGRVIKVALGAGAAPPTRVATLTLNSGEDYLDGAVIDAANGYAYFGTYTSPGQVIKVALGAGADPPTRIGSLALNGGENSLSCAAVDLTAGRAYFGARVSPGIVIKVALGVGAALPTRVGAVTLGAGENTLVSLAIDTVNSYAYAGTYTSPGRVVKVALGADTDPPTRVDALTLDAGENTLIAAAVDAANGYGYFGTYSSPSYVVKVLLGAGAAAPTRVGALALPADERYLESVGIDLVNRYAYFGSKGSGGIGRVVKVALGVGAALPTRIGALSFTVDTEYEPFAAVIDTVAGHAYFGIYGDSLGPPAVIKITLGVGGDLPTRDGSVAFIAGDSYPLSGVIDTLRGYIYIGMNTTPGRIVKFRYSGTGSTPVRIGEVPLATNENWPDCCIIDETNGYAYYLTYSNIDGTGIFVKVRLNAGDALPTRIGGLLLNALEYGVNDCAAIDAANGYGYIGTSTGKVVKINLGAGDAMPTRIGSVDLDLVNENAIKTAVIDATNGYIYFGNDKSPAKVIKVALGAGAALPAKIGTLALDAGENSLYSSAIDPANGYAYFGTVTSPAKVIKVLLGAGAALPTKIGTLTLDAGENGFYSGTVDLINGYGYFGTNTAPGRLIKIALGAGAALPTRIGSVTFDSGENYANTIEIDAAHGYAYVATNTSTGFLDMISIAPKAEFRLEYGTKGLSCAAVADWAQVPVTATTEAWEMLDSANITDGEATTNVAAGLTDPAVSFKAGEAKDIASQTTQISLGEREFTELEYSIKSTTNAAAGTAYCFRLTDAGAATPLSAAVYAEAAIAGAARHSPVGGAPSIPPVFVFAPGKTTPVDVSTTQATYYFSNPGNATAFKLIEIMLDGTRRDILTVDDPTATSITESNLTPNSRYSNREIVPLNDKGEGVESPIYPAFATLQDQPTGVVAALDAGKTTVTVVALGELPNLTAGQSGINFTDLTTAETSGWIRVPSWTVSDLKVGETYRIEAQTRNQDGDLTPPVVFDVTPTLAPVPNLKLTKGVEVYKFSLQALKVEEKILTAPGEYVNQYLTAQSVTTQPLLIDLRKDQAVLRYRVTAENVGSATAYNVIVSDKLPASLIYQPGSAAVDETPGTDEVDDDPLAYDASSSTLTVMIPELKPGESRSFVFDANLSAESSVTVKNKATAVYSDIKP